MKIRALGAGAALMALTLTALTVGPQAPRASANHATAPNEITVASAAANTIVPLANNFTVTLAVTAAAANYVSIQWELAYGPNVSFVSDVYTCQQTGATISISSSDAAAPTLVTTSIPHGFSTGDQVVIAGHTPASRNGLWTITVFSATTFTLDGTLAVAAGGATGTVAKVTGVYFPSETETEPQPEGAISLPSLAPLKILGGGANCASLLPSFPGTRELGVFVTVTLQCVSNGTSPVFMVDEATHPGNGTVLTNSAGGMIGEGIPPTGGAFALEPQYTTQSHGQRAGFDVICGVASVPPTNTPTNTPLPTNTPTQTPTPCVGPQCPTATPTKPGTATPEKMFTRTPTPTVTSQAGTAGGETPAPPSVAAPGAPGPGAGGNVGARTGIRLPDTGTGGKSGGAGLTSWLVALLSVAGGTVMVMSMALSRRRAN